jgi:hypothetical protein
MWNLPVSGPTGSLAEVHTRDGVVRYRRSGTGRTLLLLRDTGDTGALWPELEQALDGDFRVIVPAFGGDGDDDARRLRLFLEGIGCHGAAVLAAGHSCVMALELALGGPEQVSRLLLVPRGASADGAIARELEGTSDSPVPLCIVRRETPAAEAVPAVVRFLTGEG